MNRLTITRPDDWHLHLRDGPEMRSVVGFTARQFGRAIVMPNLDPPVISTAQAQAYRDRILSVTPAGSGFDPLMTLYMTDNTTPDDIAEAHASDHVYAIKLYPAGATTNSDCGVTAIDKTYPALEKMIDVGLPLLVHGEVTEPGVDIFDREAVFIDQILEPLVERFAGLKVVFEHVTSRAAVDFVRETRDGVAATITAHHLLFDRNDMLRGNIRPHLYCLPILKRAEHRMALIDAATSGNDRFFLGTDSAPHTRDAKQSASGCAGVFSAFAAVELYAEVFDQTGALERLEAFAGHHGPTFYGLPVNEDKITLVRESWTVPDAYPFGNADLVPPFAGESLNWRMLECED